MAGRRRRRAVAIDGQARPFGDASSSSAGWSSTSSEATASSTASALSPASPSSVRGDGREGLGERVGEVAEHVGRVVELDDVVATGELAPLAVGVLGEDLGAEPAGRR